MVLAPSDSVEGDDVELACRLVTSDTAVEYETTVNSSADDYAILKHPYLDCDLGFWVADDGEVFTCGDMFERVMYAYDATLIPLDTVDAVEDDIDMEVDR